MEKLGGMEKNEGGLKPLSETLNLKPWAKYINPNLVKDDVLGWVTQEEIDRARRIGAIKIRDGKSCVPLVQSLATMDAPGTFDKAYSKGDKIWVVAPEHVEYKKEVEEKNNKKIASEEYERQALDALAKI